MNAIQMIILKQFFFFFQVASQNALDQHIINKHPESRFFECKVCQKAFRTYRYLHFVHIKRCHVGLPVKYFCDICNKGFVDKSSHNNHKYTHSDAKNYVCKFCGALFHTPYGLKVHVNIHTREKKYLCTICGASFLRLCNLIGHKKRTHRSRDLRYVCEICGKLLETNKDLVKHQALHHKNGKPFSCEKCGKTFLKKKNLKDHLQIQHTQEKLHKGHCGKPFAYPHMHCHYKDFHMMEPSQQLSMDNGLIETCVKAIDSEDTNHEENVVVITVKECDPPPALYTVPTSPHSNTVMMNSDVPSSQVEADSFSGTLTTSQGVELPLLHSPFGSIGTDRIGLSAPILFTPLGANPTNTVHQEVIPQGLSPSKLETPIAQITSGIEGATFPFQPVSASAISEEHDPLKVLQERTRVSQVADPLAAELLQLPHIQTNTPNGVPVTYITAWPT